MKVIQYNEDNLAEALSNIYTSLVNIKKKKQFGYLKNYLESKDINAQTIVIEDEYISRDFLHDYVSYYALCFENYPKFCRRVHFFNERFELERFQEIIAGEEFQYNSIKSIDHEYRKHSTNKAYQKR